MIVFLLLVVIQTATSAVPMIRQQDPMIVAIDDIDGFLYEVPEYEDPELIEHQLEHSLGGMPIFTLLEMSKKQGNFKDEFPQKEKLAETKKSIDDIISKLQDTRSKLEKGIDNVYPDIEKSIQNLKKLERSFRPDVRQLLQTAMSFAKPLIMSDILEILPTKGPATSEELLVTAVPDTYEHKELSVRVFSRYKSIPDGIPESKTPITVSETSYENSKEGSKSSYDDSSSYDTSEESASSKGSSEEEKPVYFSPNYSKFSEDYAPNKSQFESDIYKKRNKKFEDTEQMALFQPKWSWKSEQVL